MSIPPSMNGMNGMRGVPANLPKRLALFACGMVAFYTLPISILAIVAAISIASTEGAAVLIDLLKVAPLLAIGGGASFYAVRLNRGLKVEKERSMEDARRTEARARTRGTIPQQAKAVAGPIRPLPARAPFATAPEQIERVRCTWCATFVSVALADAATGDVSCPSCSTSFSMRGEMQKKLGNRPAPLGLEVSTVGDSLSVSHATSPAAGVGLIMLAGVAFLLSIPHGLNARDWEPTVLTGLALVASIMASYIWSSRHTEYSLAGGTLAVRIVGFLGRSIGEWDASEVNQVFLRERVRTHKEQDSFSKRKKRVTRRSYDVILRDQAEKETRLAKDLASLDWALFIEQEIENRLHVVDRPVGKGPRR